MRIVVESAGASRGCIVLQDPATHEWRVEVSAAVDGEASSPELISDIGATSPVHRTHPLLQQSGPSQDVSHLLPASVFTYVVRSVETMQLNDCVPEFSAFADDEVREVADDTG